MSATYTDQDLEHAETRAAECKAKGDAELPGSASQQMYLDLAQKWEATAGRVRAALYPCGCAAWRPVGAGEDWHLTICGIAPAPTSLRLV